MNQPAKYRKKPVVIEAIQLLDDLDNHLAIHQWITENGGVARIPAFDQWLIIETLEGDMRADLGDWVIRGVQGEFYPCKPDIFAATYEPEDEPADTSHALPGNGHCRSCSEPIAWYRTPAEKRIPLDLAASVDGNVMIDDGVAVALSADALADSDPTVPRYLSHFATCPDAKSWRANGGLS